MTKEMFIVRISKGFYDRILINFIPELGSELVSYEYDSESRMGIFTLTEENSLRKALEILKGM